MILNEICEIINGKNFSNFSKEKTSQMQVPIIGIGGIVGYTDKSAIDNDVIAIGVRGTIGKARICHPPCAISGTQIYLIPDTSKIDFFYLYGLLKELDYTPFTLRSTRTAMDVQMFERLKISDYPLPQQSEMGLKYFIMETYAEQSERHIEGLKRFKQVMLDMMFV